MKNWPLHFTVNNNQIQNTSFEAALNRLIAYVKRFGEGDYTLSIEKKTKKRSNPQNAYYWGVVIPCVLDGLIDLGWELNRSDGDVVHEFLKESFGFYHFFETKNIISGDTSITHVSKSTTKYTTDEFYEYIEKICTWALTMLNIEIPSPEQSKNKLLW